MPLTINCWPSTSGADSYVNIEYESTVDFDLHNVAISIPVPSASSAPHINQVRACVGQAAALPSFSRWEVASGSPTGPRDLLRVPTTPAAVV